MTRRRLPRSLPEAEARALLNAASKSRDRLIVSCGLFLGLRVSEITRLEVPDLDLEAGVLLVREGKGGKDRSIPIPPSLVAELRNYLAGRGTGPVFPSPYGGALTTRAVQLLLKRLAVKAGIPDAEKPRRIHPHRLRHSFAVRCLRSGADIIEVRDLLGHSSVSTTQIYLCSAPDRLRSAVDRAAEGLAPTEAKEQSEAAPLPQHKSETPPPEASDGPPPQL